MRFAVTIALTIILQPTLLRAQQRACVPSPNPKQLPAVGTLVDSAAAIAGLAAIDAPEGMLFSLALREGDSIPLVRGLFGTDSTAAAILANVTRPQPRADETWAIRVRAAGGPALVLRTEHAVYCPPVVIPGSQTNQTRGSFTVTVQAMPDARAVRSASRRGPISFRVLVSEAGMPLRIDLNGSTGIREFDEHFKELWRNTRFQPALLDGLPVEGLYRSDQHRAKRPELPPADDDSVYLESAVDERPELASRPPLRYPDALREAGIQGRVVVQAIIDKKGRVEPQSVKVIESAHTGFNEGARDMLVRAKFHPGSIQGRAVRVLVEVPIDFTVKR